MTDELEHYVKHAKRFGVAGALVARVVVGSKAAQVEDRFTVELR